jgi:hypothetical protein
MKKCLPAAFCKTIRASGLPPRPWCQPGELVGWDPATPREGSV